MEAQGGESPWALLAGPSLPSGKDVLPPLSGHGGAFATTGGVVRRCYCQIWWLSVESPILLNWLREICGWASREPLRLQRVGNISNPLPCNESHPNQYKLGGQSKNWPPQSGLISAILFLCS